MNTFFLKSRSAYLIVFFTLIVFSNNSYAQIDTFPSPIIKGDRVLFDKKNKNVVPIGLDESGGSFIVVTEGQGFKEVPFLVHFDAAMNKINSTELPSGFQAAVFLKNELYVVTATFADSISKVTAYVEKFNKNTLQPEENRKTLGSMDYKKIDNLCHCTYPVGTVTIPAFMVKTSSDQTKVMITTNSNCHLNETRSVWVLDHTFNFLWSKETPQNSNKNEVVQVDVDNNANVFLVIRSKDPKRIEESGLSEKRPVYYLLGFFDGGSQVKEFPLLLKDKVIIDIAVSVDNNNNVICAGFYMKINPNRVAGTVFFKIDQRLKILTKTTYDDFDVTILMTKCTDEELQKVKNNVAQGKSFPHLGNFTVALHSSEKGNVFLTGEIYYPGEENTAYFRQILSFKYSNEGELIWSNKIPKYQQTNGWGQYSSCFTTCIGEDFYVVYNDNTSNFNIKPCEVPDIFTLRAEFILVVVKVDQKGIATKKYMLPNIKEDVWMRPLMTKIFNTDQLILVGDSVVNHSYKIFKTTLKY